MYITIRHLKLIKFLKSLEENIGKNLTNASMTSKVKAITEYVYTWKKCVYVGSLLLRVTAIIFLSLRNYFSIMNSIGLHN